MSKFSYKRVGMALIGLAVPFMAVGSAAAAPGADEVSSVELACLAYFDISTCTHAVGDGVIDVVEDEVNSDLSDQGVDYVVDVGEPVGAEPFSPAPACRVTSPRREESTMKLRADYLSIPRSALQASALVLATLVAIVTPVVRPADAAMTCFDIAGEVTPIAPIFGGEDEDIVMRDDGGHVVERG
jgi:hypothetical protein